MTVGFKCDVCLVQNSSKEQDFVELSDGCKKLGFNHACKGCYEVLNDFVGRSLLSHADLRFEVALEAVTGMYSCALCEGKGQVRVRVGLFKSVVRSCPDCLVRATVATVAKLQKRGSSS